MVSRRELPMLAGIAGIIRWVEELANLLSGPLLTVGLGIALIDLLTDGSLLTRMPLLLYAWAISQAIGVDAQLVATWDRARLALREGRYWALVGLIVLGAVLAYVAWVAAQVFALQESEGVTTGVALARLGMDSAGWLVQRTALSVFLVCLAGWTRYYPPARDVALSAEEERQKLEADLMLEPLRAQLRTQQLRGARGAWDALRGKRNPYRLSEAVLVGSELPPAGSDAANVPEQPHEKPPTGPGSPRRKRRQQPRGLNPDGNVVKMSRRQRRRSDARGVARGSVELLAREHFTSGMTAGELARLAGISKGAASKWRRVLQTEADAATSQAAR